MELDIHDDKKQVHVWLTNAEKNDPAVQTKLKELYRTYKEKKYLVTVFQSGGQDLRRSVLDLLAYNRTRCAELEVQREKKQKVSGLER